MTDPLSITASIVGITVPALYGIRLLLQDLQQLKDAPRTLQDLADDVRSVETAIQLLEAVEETEWAHLGTAIAEGSKATISSASKACSYFRSELQKWTKHSQGRKITLQDRATVGFLKKDEVKAMSQRLQSCNVEINSIVGLSTLHNSVRHTHMTEDLRTAITRLQEDVKSALANADRQLVLLDDKKEDIDGDDDEDEGKPEKLQLLEERLKAMEASHRLLEELLLQAQEDMIAKTAAEDKSNSSTKSAVVHGDQVSGMKVVGTISGGTYSWGKGGVH